MSRIVFVGDSPHAPEVEVRFNQFLSEAGIRHSDYRMTTVVKERPPSPDFAAFAGVTKQGKRAGEVWTTPSYDKYEQRLYAELAECKANVIVALGNWPLYTLTRKYGVEKWRGSQLEAVPELGGRKVIPTYHPAATLPGRDFYAQYPLKWDLARIKRHAEFPELRIPQRTLQLCPTFEQAMAYIEDCHTLPAVAHDIETSPRGGTKKQPNTWEMVCFSLAKAADDAICIPFLGENGLYWQDEHQHRDIMVALARLLEDKSVLKVGQNINYDWFFELFKHGIDCWPVYDTMIAQRLLMPDLAADLGFLTSMYTEEPYYKDDGKQWDNIRDWYQFYRYAALDSAVLMEIKPKQEADLERKGIRRCYDRTIRTMPACMYMQLKGVRSDEATMVALREQLTAELAEQCAEILAIVRADATHFTLKKGKKAGEQKEFDNKFPNSSDQLQAYFYMVHKHKPYRKPKSEGGGVTCDDKALQRLARIDAPFATVATLVLAYKEKHTLVKNYLRARLYNGRFVASWKAGNQDSGRTSASKNSFGYGFNLTTLPRKGPVKKMFLADEGYLMVSNDYSQAEARILAYVAGVRAKIDAYETGKDGYSITASKIAERLGYKLTWEEIFAQDKAGVMAPIAGEKFTWRKIGKECDLGLGYNLGVDKFSRNTGMPLADTKIVHPAWHLVYPEVKHGYHAMIQGMLNKDRTVYTPTGDRRKFLGPYTDVLESAYSWFCQRTVASMLQERALALFAEGADVLGLADLLLQVHDSVVWQMPLTWSWESIADTLAHLKHHMEQPLHWRGTTFVVPVSTSVSGRSLGHMVELGTGELTSEALQKGYEESLA